MQHSDLSSWLALSHMPKMSSQLINKLLTVFGSPEMILGSDQLSLAAAGLKPEFRALLSNFQNGKGQAAKAAIEVKVEESLQWQSSSKNHHILCRHDDGYPYLLKEIPNPPPLLYVKGDLSKLSFPQLAMVGSRNPGPTGRKNAKRFALELTKAGLLVCSGMALGIDYESHLGALEAGGTVAVLGTGIDQVYPRQNQGLAEKISEQGVLVSEFPLGTKPQKWHFPLRNRIISGLSLGTLVVEAALRSGSLITARYALEQGREVFAIPGSIHSPTTKGCHALIKEGAKLVEKLEDITEELMPLIDLVMEQSGQGRAHQFLTSEESLVISKLDFDPVKIDTLLIETKFSVRKLTVLLVELELKNVIEAIPGGYALLAP